MTFPVATLTFCPKADLAIAILVAATDPPAKHSILIKPSPAQSVGSPSARLRVADVGIAAPVGSAPATIVEYLLRLFNERNIAPQIPRLHPFNKCLVLPTDPSSTRQWITHASTTLRSELSNPSTRLQALKSLSSHLSSKTFVLGDSPSPADLFVYAALVPVVTLLSLTQRLEVAHAVRYFDLVQNWVLDAVKKDRLEKYGVGLKRLEVELDPAGVVAELTLPSAAGEAGTKESKKEKKAGAADEKKVEATAAAPAPKDGKAKDAKAANEDKKEAKPVNGESSKDTKPSGKEKEKELKDNAKPKEAKKGEGNKGGLAKAAAAPANDVVDPSRLDLRVARVLDVSKHPDADSLYVEQMEVGEDKPRTVVSGLVKHMKESDLKDKLVVLVCNLKPAKMRGIESQAMVLCATDPETGKVELIEPAASSKPGERVYFGEYSGTPDAVLNPKKKVWETVQPQFITDAKCRATYVDAESKAVSVMVTASGGECKATSVVGGGIK